MRDKKKTALTRKTYYLKNKDKIRKNQKEYRANNKEKIAARSKIYREANSEELLAKAREWNRNNVEWRKKWKKEYYAKNKEAALSRKIGMQVRVYCKRAAFQKKSPTFEYFDYTAAELLEHLKTTVPDGYEWEDFFKPNVLHIDHKKSLKNFGYPEPGTEDFKKAWSFSNLQLLPARKNISKG